MPALTSVQLRDEIRRDRGGPIRRGRESVRGIAGAIVCSRLEVRPQLRLGGKRSGLAGKLHTQRGCPGQLAGETKLNFFFFRLGGEFGSEAPILIRITARHLVARGRQKESVTN